MDHPRPRPLGGQGSPASRAILPPPSHCLRGAGGGAARGGAGAGGGRGEGRGGWERRGRGEMLSLQGRRRRRRQRREREEGEKAGRGQPKAGPGGWTGCRLRCAALGSDGLSHALRAPGWAGPAAGGEAPLHGPEDQHVPGPLPILPGDPHGGLRPQPTGEAWWPGSRDGGRSGGPCGVGSRRAGEQGVIRLVWRGEGCAPPIPAGE